MPRKTERQVFRIRSKVAAVTAVSRTFDLAPRRVFSPKQIDGLIKESRDEWGVLASAGTDDVRERLMRIVPLRELTLGSDSYSHQFVRYLWRNPTPFEVAASLRANAYLCHASATWLHHLADRTPNELYLNAEQSAKPRSEGALNQVSIDRAFRGPQRCSKFAFQFGDTKIVLVNGKNTGCLGVEDVPIDQQYRVRVTNFERTLIDIAVRPAYSGGVNGVMDAYRRAISRVSVENLVSILRALDYTYPYHQAIGFYLARAGCDCERLALLKSLGLNWDFYLAHKMGRTSYDSEWRVHYPRGV